MMQDQILDESFIIPNTSIQGPSSGGRRPNPKFRRRCNIRMTAKPVFSWAVLLHLLVMCLLCAPCWLAESAAQPLARRQLPSNGLFVNHHIEATPSQVESKGVFQLYASVMTELAAGFSIWIWIPKEVSDV